MRRVITTVLMRDREAEVGSREQGPLNPPQQHPRPEERCAVEAPGVILAASCPAAPGPWWTSSQPCPSSRSRSRCTRWSAPIQPPARRRKVSTSQSASSSSPSAPASKVSAVPCSLEQPPAPTQQPPHTHTAHTISPFIQHLPLSCPGPLVARLKYTLQLDGHRTRSRGLFPGGKPELRGNTTVTPVQSCTKFWFHFPVREPAPVPGRGGWAGGGGRWQQVLGVQVMRVSVLPVLQPGSQYTLSPLAAGFYCIHVRYFNAVLIATYVCYFPYSVHTSSSNTSFSFHNF